MIVTYRTAASHSGGLGGWELVQPTLSALWDEVRAGVNTPTPRLGTRAGRIENGALLDANCFKMGIFDTYGQSLAVHIHTDRSALKHVTSD